MHGLKFKHPKKLTNSVLPNHFILLKLNATEEYCCCSCVEIYENAFGRYCHLVVYLVGYKKITRCCLMTLLIFTKYRCKKFSLMKTDVTPIKTVNIGMETSVTQHIPRYDT